MMKERERLEEFVLLAQSISGGSLLRLFKQFKRYDKTILFIVHMQWEELDSFETEMSVVMVRLPFSSPKDPVFLKREQLMKNAGRSSFYELSLPEAVLRFKESVGRFLCSKGTFGNIIILDKRIYSTKYGKVFLRSIPKVPLQIVNLPTLYAAIEKRSNKGS